MDKDVIRKYYDSGIEQNRLWQNYFKLEGIRTKEIISRYLSSPGLKILDAGGGTGFYAFWLHSLGHDVTLSDLTESNIRWAENYSKQNNIQLAGYKVDDAMDLRYEDNTFDIVLLLGPLYHLTERKDRISAFAEAKRVLKPNGIVIAAVISRYASLFDGFRRNLISDDQFMEILKEDIRSGIHQNPTGNPEYFTTSFFHTTSEIQSEINESQLNLEKLIAVEGVGWLIDIGKFENDENHLRKILEIIRSVETNPDLIATSPHILAVAKKN